MSQDPHHGPPGGQPPSGWGQPPPSDHANPGGTLRQPGPADLVGSGVLANAHHQPHAASAGPSDGARGAMWFPILMAVVVVLCLIGIVAIVASS